jgi:hypothetical protein
MIDILSTTYIINKSILNVKQMKICNFFFSFFFVHRQQHVYLVIIIQNYYKVYTDIDNLVVTLILQLKYEDRSGKKSKVIDSESTEVTYSDPSTSLGVKASESITYDWAEMKSFDGVAHWFESER